VQRFGVLAAGRGRGILILACLWGLVLAAVACSDAAERPRGLPERLAPRPVRHLLPLPWDTILHLIVEPEDTLLFSVDGVRADAERIWVLDRIGRRLTVFDWEGRVSGQVGREGAGPGEFLQPQTFDLDDRGWAWVLDEGTGRISTFDPEGTLRGEILLGNLGTSLGAFVPDGGGEGILGLTHDRGLRLVRIDGGGGVELGALLPAPETPQVWGFAFQGHAHRKPGSLRWAFAFSSGDGWFLLDSLTVVGGRRLYPEAVTFPRMIEEVAREGDVTHTVRRLSEPRFAARSVAVAGDRVWIAFAGESEERGRLLEGYDVETGAYQYSLLLPRVGRVFVWEDRVLLYANDPVPELLVLRLPDP